MTTDFGKVRTLIAHLVGKPLDGAAGRLAQDVVASGHRITAEDALRRELARGRLGVGTAALTCMDCIGRAHAKHGAAAVLRSVSVGAGHACQ